MEEKGHYLSPIGDHEKYGSPPGESSTGTRTPESSQSLLEEAARLEAQTDHEPTQRVPAEKNTSFTTKLVFLGAYFFLNLTLTVSNKALLGKVPRDT